MTGLFQIGDKLLQAQDMPSLLKRYQLMPQFLRGVIVDQAIASFSCSDEERHSAVENFLAQHQLTAPEAKEAWLRSQNMTEEELQEMAVRPLLIEKFKQATWRPKVDNYFLTRKASLDHVVYSLIRTKNPALANELYFRILEGEQTFAEVARDFSEGRVQVWWLVGPSTALAAPPGNQQTFVRQPAKSTLDAASSGRMDGDYSTRKVHASPAR